MKLRKLIKKLSPIRKFAAWMFILTCIQFLKQLSWLWFALVLLAFVFLALTYNNLVFP